MGATVIISSEVGRLGNRLFLSAYFMANALARGYSLMNPALGEYARFFEHSAGDPLCRFPLNDFRMDPEVAAQCREVFLAISKTAGAIIPGGKPIDIRNNIEANSGIYDLNGPEFSKLLQEHRFLFVKGWKFRDDTNLVLHQGLISRYFLPIDPIRESAEAVLRNARAKGDIVIGVHIRHGDYREWKNGAHYFETEQYAHWMREAAALNTSRKTVFLVCASDQVDCSIFRGLEVVMGPGSVIGDMHALSLCDRIMGPPSTFSTWASYTGRVPLCMLQHHAQQLSVQSFALHDRV